MAHETDVYIPTEIKDELPYENQDHVVKTTSHRRSRQFVADQDKDIKYWERRQRNNIAAKKCRDTREKTAIKMNEHIVLLQRENKQLKRDISVLRGQMRGYCHVQRLTKTTGRKRHTCNNAYYRHCVDERRPSHHPDSPALDVLQQDAKFYKTCQISKGSGTSYSSLQTPEMTRINLENSHYFRCQYNEDKYRRVYAPYPSATDERDNWSPPRKTANEGYSKTSLLTQQDVKIHHRDMEAQPVDQKENACALDLRTDTNKGRN